jgi:hypothetical protein
MATLSSNTKQLNIELESDRKITILRDLGSGPFNPWWMLTSFLLTVAISMFIYIIIDYYYLELVTRDIVLSLLQLTGVDAHVTDFAFPYTPDWGQFGEASSITPGISIVGAPYSAFWIVKACTGMQAGAILIALIFVTPIPLRGKFTNPDLNIEELSFKDRLRVNHTTLYSFLHKLSVAVLFFFVLFIANSVRIWFHLYLVGAYNIPFEFAHDDLSKPIGFVGTLIFAWIIEKSGIPIIDTFADWMDSSWSAMKYFTRWIYFGLFLKFIR